MKVNVYIWFVLFLGFVLIQDLNAQVVTDTLTNAEAQALKKRLDKQLSKSQKKVAFQFLPIIYYTPETKLALGASGVISFKLNSLDTVLEPSQITPSFVYTLNKQILAQVGYNLHLNRMWLLKGRIGYFVYPYFFAGVGNNHDGNYQEWYDAEYPLFSANLTRKIYKQSLSVGILYDFQNTKITSTSDSLLVGKSVSGSSGSTQSALGFTTIWNTRDFDLSSTKGWYANLSVQWVDPNLGASYTDQIVRLDVRKYISLTKKKDVLALQLFSETHHGDVPFNLMSMLGGSKLMRGYQRGVYRDRQMMVYQAEFRSRLLFNYFGFVLFGNYGAIGNNFDDLNKNYRYTYGAGIRFTPLPKKRYFIRLDYGKGQNTQGFYIEVGEAF